MNSASAILWEGEKLIWGQDRVGWAEGAALKFLVYVRHRLIINQNVGLTDKSVA